MLSLLLMASVFPLEWNPTFPAGIPYEVEISRAKLGATSFVVKADGASIPVETLAGTFPGCDRLRFTVPERTERLMCETVSGKPAPLVTECSDNLFRDALEDRRAWTLPDGVSLRREADGVLLRASTAASQSARVFCDVPVPVGLAGRNVRQDIDVTSRSTTVWSGEIQIDQIDAEGRTLPETLSDWRWTTHMRPIGKLTRYRNAGRIHPRARWLRLNVELRRPGIAFDRSGEPIIDPAESDPSLLISHLEVRPAEGLPFPKWSDAFFGPGVSGEKGDAAFVSGGAGRHAFFFQTHTRGCWSNAYQFRNERDLAFPSAAGTVEAWFRPDKPVGGSGAVVLFQGHQGYSSLKRDPAPRKILELSYDGTCRQLSLFISDWCGHDFRRTFPDVDMPAGVWTHVALQWTPGGQAEVFVGGKSAGTLVLTAFEATPIEDPSIANVNDLWVTELFVGASAQAAREVDDPSGMAFFDGLIDNVRASTGCRYTGAFEPQRKIPVADAATRALFAFNRTFDGVQGGGGFGEVPACVEAREDRVAHRLKTDQGDLQYFPDEIPPSADSARTFNLDNYGALPQAADFRQAYVRAARSFEVRPGEEMRIDMPARFRMDFVEVANRDDIPLEKFVVRGEGRPDPRSFGDLAKSLVRPGMSDRERADAAFQYVLSITDYFINRQVRFPADSDIPHSVCNDAIVHVNAYCGFECGYLNNLAANLSSSVADCPSSQAAGYGHSFHQVFFDGKDHTYDVALQKFFTDFSNESAASLEDGEAQPGLFRRTGRSADNFIRKGTRVRGGHGANDPRYEARCAPTLNPGETFRVWRRNDGQMNNLHFWPKRGRFTGVRRGPDEYDYTSLVHTGGDNALVLRRDRLFPDYSTGILSFDGVPKVNNPAFERVASGRLAYRVRTTFPVVWGSYAAWRDDGAPVALSLSTDGGRTFRPLPKGVGDGVSLEYLVKAHDGFLIGIECPADAVRRFCARTEVQMNPRAYPGWLQPGTNRLTIAAVTGGKAAVTFAWGELAKEIDVAGGCFSGAIAGCERRLFARDPAEGLALPVSGVSSPTVRAHGRVKARMDGGVLRVGYDPSAAPLLPRGDDNPENRAAFPCFAAVDIEEEGAARSLTFLIAPGIRLVSAAEAQPLGRAALRKADASSPQSRVWCEKRGDGARFRVEGLPDDDYAVFTLVRFPGGSGREGAAFTLNGHSIGSAINPTADFYSVRFGAKGARGRWKWDCGIRKDLQFDYNGWIIRNFRAPEEGVCDVVLAGDCAEGAEIAALLFVRAPELEPRLDLRRMLFGLDCDPAHVK